MPLSAYFQEDEASIESVDANARLRGAPKKSIEEVLPFGSVGPLGENLVRGFGQYLIEGVQASEGTDMNLSSERANELFGIEGELKFDKSVTQSEARYRNVNKRDEIFRRTLIENNDKVTGLEAFGRTIGGNLVEPANLGLSLVPVARVGSVVAKAGTARGALLAGANAGLQGGLLTESITYGNALSQGRDYSLNDALVGVGVSTVFGASLTGGGYGVKKLFDYKQSRGPKAMTARVIEAKSEQYSIPLDFAVRVAEIESGFGSNVRAKTSSAKGVFQFIDSTWAAYGQGRDVMDVEANTDAFMRLTQDNQKGLKGALGRDPTAGELYLAHQQGLGGAIALLREPQKRAVDVLAGLRKNGKPIGLDAAKERILDNGGDIDMTAEAFSSRWSAKMGEASLSGQTIQNPVTEPDMAPPLVDVKIPEVIKRLDAEDQESALLIAAKAMAEGKDVDLSSLVVEAVRRPRAPASLVDQGEEIKLPGRLYEPAKAITVEGQEVPVRFMVMEARDLITSHDDDLFPNRGYPEEMQPRDRGRAGSQAKLLDIESKFHPERLIGEVGAESGAPIIGRDGIVESGNGRVILLRRNAMAGSDIFSRYRQALIDDGYDVTGMEAPVLVRVRTNSLDPRSRVALAREMNKDTVERMSVTEQAMVDRDIMGDAFDLYQGGAVTELKNQAFLMQFMKTAGRGNENQLIDAKTKRLSQQGQERLQAALMAKAFDDANLVAAVFESSIPQVKTLGAAMAEAAPSWAKMRAMAGRGEIVASADPTRYLVEAASFVKHVREQRLNMAASVEGAADQLGLFGFDGLTPEAKAFVGLFYTDDNLKVQRKASQIANDLAELADEAMKRVNQDELFGAPPEFDVSRVIGALRDKAKKTGLFTQEDADVVTGTGTGPDNTGGWVSQDRREESAALIDTNRPEHRSEPRRGDTGDGDQGGGAVGSERGLFDGADARPELKITAIDDEITALDQELETLRLEGFDDDVADPLERPDTYENAMGGFLACVMKGGA